MSTGSGKNLYRSRQGAVFGVCRGLASYFEFPVFWVRLFTAVLIAFTGFWPGLILYVLAALLMRPEPLAGAGPFGPPASGPSREAFRQRLADLERRIRGMEDRVTSREFDWERRLRNRP